MISLFLLLVHLLLLLVLRPITNRRRRPKSVAFFHPYCNSGGGGERVLWRGISALQKSLPNWEFVIYTERIKATDDEILAGARALFNIDVDAHTIKFVRLRFCWLIKPASFLTMILQLFGGLWLSVEAILRFTPSVCVDSTGIPLSLPVFRYIGGAKTACYVHYPTITKEMVDLVRRRTATYNNRNWITNFYVFTLGKMLYYYDLATLYAFCMCKCSDLVMTNGSWTNSHICDLFGPHGADERPPTIVYPPCDVEALCPPYVAHYIKHVDVEGNSELASSNNEAFDPHDRECDAERLLREERRVYVLSVGQIRPEKNHELQLAAFADARYLIRQADSDIHMTLIIAGGCRNKEDQYRLKYLQKIAVEKYDLEDNVDVMWRIGVPFSQLLDLYHMSLIGIHTMWNEHFGISVVEALAAGTIMIAHNSGPKLDIIGGYISPPDGEIDVPCGFLAQSVEDYAHQIADIVFETPERRAQVRRNAFIAVQRFSNTEFDERFSHALMPIIDLA